MNNHNDPLNNVPARYVRLRSVPATALDRGFEDRVIEVQNISSIERYPDFPTFAIVLTFQGVAFITSHNFDTLTKALNPVSVSSGGERVEEKILMGEQARQAELIAKAERQAALVREAEKQQIDDDNEGVVLSLAETREKLEAASELDLIGDEVVAIDGEPVAEDAVVGDESIEPAFGGEDGGPV